MIWPYPFCSLFYFPLQHPNEQKILYCFLPPEFYASSDKSAILLSILLYFMPTNPECLLHLSPYHPFTPRHAEILFLIANGETYHGVAEKLGISHQTVKSTVFGTATVDEANGEKQPSRSSLGIFGTVELLTGVRPLSMTNCVVRMIGEGILLFGDMPPDHADKIDVYLRDHCPSPVPGR